MRRRSSASAAIVPPRVGDRKVIDVIVQSSTVVLFHSYNVAVAPAAVGEQKPATSNQPQLTGIVRFRGKGFNGTLELTVLEDTLVRIENAPAGLHGRRDLIRELTNQLMGRVKNKLLQFQITVEVGLPTALTSPAQKGTPSRESRELSYVFRTRQGPIVVVLNGEFDETALVFSAAELVAGEGDVILF